MKRTCAAFGGFDGVHTGHRAVVETLLRVSAERELDPVLVVFEPEPGERFLTTREEKRYLLEKYPLKEVLFLPRREADGDFAREVLAEELGAGAVIIGGCHPQVNFFRQSGSQMGFDVVECETVTGEDGLPVDAGGICRALAENRLEEAERLLGHPYVVMGEVVTGKQLGRTVGQPTANIDFPQSKVLPPDGSYITVTLVDGQRRVGLTNIGKRPTVDNFDYTTIENHILDFSGDLYGKVLVLEVLRFIRGVEKFDSLAAVKQQIDRDIGTLREYIASVK